MSWNHRVIRHICKRWEAEPNSLELAEVYYDLPSKGQYMHGSISLVGGSIADVKWIVEHLKRALDQPILDCKCDASGEE